MNPECQYFACLNNVAVDEAAADCESDCDIV